MKKIAGLSIIAALSTEGASGVTRPNVIFFLTDDQGWADSSLYGSTFYKTPSMERLAESSIRFFNAYSASPQCSPSRASIMSGQYPARHGMTAALGHLGVKADDVDYQPMPAGFRFTSSVVLPESRKVLALEQYTLAEAFRDAGYRTGFVGKWHMGQDPEFWPDQQGFEFVFRGAPDPGPPSFFSPYKFRAGTVTDGPTGEYLTDRATEESLKYIHNGDPRPFFLCLWHWAVHTPHQAKAELVEYYRNHPDPQGRQLSPTMAAMIQSMDESLGHLLDDLERTGLDKNTIIIFTSDNGAPVHTKVSVDGGVPPSSNWPLRKGKAALFEGGARVPALIRWPGVTDRGGVSEAVIGGVDYYPTLLEMCGIPNNPAQVVDGVSLVPVLKGEELSRDLFCFFPHNYNEHSPAGAWMRQGDWKLIEVFYVSDLWPEKYMLYNLKDDIGETRNLAAQHPERTAAMAAALKAHYMTLCDRPPIPNPDYSPEKLPVNGWVSSTGDGHLAVVGGLLTLTAPGISTRALPRESGKFKLSWKMRTQRSGSGKVLWADFTNRTFRPERCNEYALLKGGVWQEYTVEFESVDNLFGVRIDFGPGLNPVEIEMIALYREDGTLVERWSF